MWIPLEVQGCLPIGILKLTLHYQRNPPLTFVYTHLPPRNVSVLHAVRDHRAQGRHWANLTGLYGHFSRAFGISKLDDFKAAGSKAEWREVCRAVEHNNTLYVPAADCDYQVKSAHKLLTHTHMHTHTQMQGGETTLPKLTKKSDRVIFARQLRDAVFNPSTGKAGLVWVGKGSLTAKSMEGSICPRCNYIRHAGCVRCFLGEDEYKQIGWVILLQPHVHSLIGTDDHAGMDIAKAAAERCGRTVEQDEQVCARAHALARIRARAHAHTHTHTHTHTGTRCGC